MEIKNKAQNLAHHCCVGWRLRVQEKHNVDVQEEGGVESWAGCQLFLTACGSEDSFLILPGIYNGDSNDS